MQSTESRILMKVADGDARYWVFTPLDERREEFCGGSFQGQPLLEEGVAFADGQDVWVLEEGNHADYVYLRLHGSEHLNHPGSCCKADQPTDA